MATLTFILKNENMVKHKLCSQQFSFHNSTTDITCNLKVVSAKLFLFFYIYISVTSSLMSSSLILNLDLKGYKDETLYTRGVVILSGGIIFLLMEDKTQQCAALLNTEATHSVRQ